MVGEKKRRGPTGNCRLTIDRRKAERNIAADVRLAAVQHHDRLGGLVGRRRAAAHDRTELVAAHGHGAAKRVRGMVLNDVYYYTTILAASTSSSYSLHNCRVHILRDERRLGAHPQFAAADGTEPAHLDVEEAVRIAAPSNSGQRELDVLAANVAAGHRLGAEAHQRQRLAGQAQMVAADQSLLLGQALAL